MNKPWYRLDQHMPPALINVMLWLVVINGLLMVIHDMRGCL